MGTDFCGPLYARTKTNPTKVYICIFTCASSRMLHLELTNDMPTNEFLQAFQHMINHRGMSVTLFGQIMPKVLKLQVERSNGCLFHYHQRQRKFERKLIKTKESQSLLPKVSSGSTLQNIHLGGVDGGRDFVEVSRSHFEKFLGKLSSLTQSCIPFLQKLKPSSMLVP